MATIAERPLGDRPVLHRTRTHRQPDLVWLGVLLSLLSAAIMLTLVWLLLR